MRYFLGLIKILNFYVNTLISGSGKVFNAQFQQLQNYIFIVGIIIITIKFVLILYWIYKSIFRYKMMLMSLTMIPKDILLDSNTANLLKKIV